MKCTRTGLIAAVASLCLMASACAQDDRPVASSGPTAPTREDVRAVSPALEQYTQRVLEDDLWKRPGLSRGIAASPPLRS